MTAKRKPNRGPAWELADAIERRREELGMQWSEVYDRYGLYQSVVNRWKTNTRPPNLAKVGHRAAAFLDIPFAEVRRLAGAVDEEDKPKRRFTQDEIRELIDEADNEGWELIKNRVLRRIAREDTDQ